MFQKILIANRGEIACRVAATARRLGVRTVAVYSQADAGAAHVLACDEAVPIGGAAPQDSYLHGARILQAARASGAQAIHPGYGFLSENADFAQACQDGGVVFIGPPPAAIRAMGLKAQAKQLMAQAGVPLVPGYHGAGQDTQHLYAQAQRLGCPLLIKASAGGGGRGMRRVERLQDFAAALQSCQREAASSFGDAAVLLEKYVQRPRHIEVQIFADAHGQCVHLFERDCSVQRRHQKILEEAPAPGLPEALRTRMGQAAIAAARAVGYVGAGTVEFIVEQSGGYDQPAAMRFYFMEMNTRLQVEHPVTEAITGQDLVEWQLRVACGQALPRRQQDLRIHGHAIEARICAENPGNAFLPATGHLAVYRKPACAQFAAASVRVDDGVRQGDTISAHYDSMLAKLIVHGENRQQALALLDAALSATHIVGLPTNVQFLRRVAASAAFTHARLDTALIEREQASLLPPHTLPAAQAVACAVAHILQAERAQENADPFSRRDGWRISGASQRRWQFRLPEPSGEPAPHTLSAHLHYQHNGALHLAIYAAKEPLNNSWRRAGAADLGAVQGANRSRSGATARICNAAQCQNPLTPAPPGIVQRFPNAADTETAAPDDGSTAALLRWQRCPDDAAALTIEFAGQHLRAQVYAHTDGRQAAQQYHIFTAQGAAVLHHHDPQHHANPDSSAQGGQLTAPMPGKIIAFTVQAGDAVRQGQPLAVLEAMKMEHTIAAPRDGVIAEVLYAAGEQVAEGAQLLRMLESGGN